jgi:diguanylate cyclase (GGDEF)-like protein/PAS domain S-box-containing protein/putative nucleotidyltransferase with HDIG domain
MMSSVSYRCKKVCMMELHSPVDFEEVFNLTPIFLCILDAQGYFLMANEMWEKELGHKVSDLLHTSISLYIHPEDIKETDQHISQLNKGENIEGYANRYRHINGTYRLLEWRAYQVGSLIYGAAQDITSFHQLRYLEHSELQLYNLLFDQSLTSISVAMLDYPITWQQVIHKERGVETLLRNLKFERTNAAFLQQFHVTAQHIIGQSLSAHYKDHIEMLKPKWLTLMEKKSVSFEIEHRTKKNSPLWFQTNYTALYNNKQEFVGVFGIHLDITSRKHTEIELEKSEQRLRMIAENVSDAIWVYNVTLDQYTYMSPAIQHILGYSPQEYIGKDASFSILPEDTGNLTRSIEKDVRRFSKSEQGRLKSFFVGRSLTNKGVMVWTDTTISYRYTSNGDIEAIGVTRDVTEHKRFEQKILDLSYRDQLTNLFNRRYIEEHQKRIFSESKNYPISLLMVDVNGLKLVNDVFGHTEGDRLLQTSAYMLTNHIFSPHIIARIGGDEFLAICTNTTAEQMNTKLDYIQKEIHSNNKKISFLSLACGYATAVKPPALFELLFQEAEEMMYRYKLLGSGELKQSIVRFLMKNLEKVGENEKRHGHVVAMLCAHIANKAGYLPVDLEEIKSAGLLHDVGKISLSPALTDKKSPLTEEEEIEMRRHSELGYHILRSVQNFGRVAEWILMHHEQPDGKGFPQGLTDTQIPFSSKIIAVANAYDLMTFSYNQNREVFSHEEAIQRLISLQGSVFDSRVVDIFVKIPKELVFNMYKKVDQNR